MNGLVPLHRISESDSRVKTDSNCLLQMFALSRVSVFKIPFSLSEVIPNASFLRDLTNDQNFFTFSTFLGQSGSGFVMAVKFMAFKCLIALAESYFVSSHVIVMKKGQFGPLLIQIDEDI